MLKLNIHSIVDLITNSSTVIFTYQDSETQAKELLQEILKLSGVEKPVDELFYFGVFLDDFDQYSDYIDDNNIELKDYPKKWKEQNAYLENMIQEIMRGDIKRPKWFDEVEDNYEYCAPSRSLYITAKDDKYKPLVDKMLKFLNSQESDGGMDG